MIICEECGSTKYYLYEFTGMDSEGVVGTSFHAECEQCGTQIELGKIEE